MEVHLAVILSCYFIVVGAQQNGDLKLTGSTVPTGRVEIYLVDEWGTIRYDSSDVPGQRGAAQAICRQLGFADVQDHGVIRKFSIPVDESNPVLLKNVDCNYNSYTPNAVNHVLRCDYAADNVGDHKQDMAVVCKSNSYLPYDTEVRLVDGTTGYESSGFVEIYLHGNWGPVCNMNQDDANSTCRQLGYTRSVSISEQHYESGLSDQVDTFNCFGVNTYSCLRSCFVYPSILANISCNQQHSSITCTFDPNREEGYGSDATCNYAAAVLALIVGVTVAVVLVVLMVLVCVCVAICCCCIPGCIFYGSRRNSYQNM